MQYHQGKMVRPLPSGQLLARAAWSWVLACALAACGGLPADSGTSASEADSEETSSFTPNSQAKSSSLPKPLVATSHGITIDIPVALTARGFSLAAAATTYTINLTGCDSGYNSTANQASSNLQAYKYDSNCLAKLTGFTFNDFTFTPSVGDPFTTWLVGDEAIFVAAENASVTLVVKVAATLDNPVDETDTVEYVFYDIDSGANADILAVTFGTSGDLPGGVQPVPAFLLIKSVLVGESAGGGIQYTFTLECSVAMIGDACAGVDLSTVQYTLVEDTYGGSPDYAAAVAAFAGGGQAVNPATDKLGAGQGGAANGGFVTTSGAGVLTTPEPVEAHPHMILFLEAGGLSYRYFNLDVTVSIQN